MKCLFSTPHQTAADPRTVENLRQLGLANLQRKLEPEVRAAVANSLTAQLEPVVRMFLKEKLEADVRQEQARTCSSTEACSSGSSGSCRGPCRRRSASGGTSCAGEGVGMVFLLVLAFFCSFVLFYVGGFGQMLDRCTRAHHSARSCDHMSFLLCFCIMYETTLPRKPTSL